MRPPRPARAFATLLGLAGLSAAPLAAAAPAVHALTGARVVTAPGTVLETATVVLRDGVVEAVGPEVEPPADARLWDLAGLTVYPGLIEPYLERNWGAEGAAPAPVPGGHPNPLVRPEREMIAHPPDAASVKQLRAAGFTTAAVAPAQGIFRGRGAVVQLGDGDPNEQVLRRTAAQHLSFATNQWGGGYPTSRMGALALVRQTLLDAAWYRQAHRAYERNPAQPRPPVDTALEALAEVAAGGELLVVETESPTDTLRALALATELGLDLHLVGNGKEHRWLPAIAASPRPHLLPLDFPETPAPVEPDDLAIGLAELRDWDLAPDNPRRLIEAGVPVAFTTHRLDDPARVHARLAAAVARGLTATDALAGLTTVPARLLGLADRLGTIAPGMTANLVVVEGELLVEAPKIRAVWIDGRRYEVRAPEPPAVEPAGEWAITVVTGSGEIPVTLRLRGAAAALEGAVLAMDRVIPLQRAAVSGKTLELRFEGDQVGMPGTVTMELSITGATLSGKGDSPRGTFQVRGRRVAGPEGVPESPASEPAPEPAPEPEPERATRQTEGTAREGRP